MDDVSASSAYGFQTCPTCWRQLPAGSAFCGFDGTVLQASGPKRHCPSCQKLLPAYASFCPADGSRLITESPSRSPSLLPAESSIGSQPTLDDDSFEDFDEVLWSEESLVDRIVADKYHIDELLDRGGMAEIYRATHQQMSKSVVIKIMHSSQSSQVSALKRFQQECRVTAQIDHPNIVSVYDTGMLDDKRPYLVMEFIKGESLRDRLGRENTLSFSESAHILIAVCSGLEAAHQQGIVHRDLKPENIMLREDESRTDWVKVVDFGIARLRESQDKLTKTGMTIGTMDYLAPEYLRDHTVDQRCDIYALGIILYEMITGQCPFTAHTPIGLVAKHLWGTVEQPSKFCQDTTAGGTIDRIVARCLEKDPQLRYQSASELREALQQALAELSS